MSRPHIAPLALLLTVLSTAHAQTPGAPAAPAYPQEAFIIERQVRTVRFEADGSGTRHVVSVVRMQSDAGVKAYAVLTFPYGSANQAVDIAYVRVRKPDGAVVNTPAYNIQDMPADVTRVAPLYSDLHEKHVAVKGLGIGDVLEYETTVRTIKPEVPGQFWFEHQFFKNGIIKDDELEISVPRDKYVNVKSPDLKPQVRDEGDRRIYTWKTSNLEHKVEQNEQPMRYQPAPSVQLTTFHSWQEVGRWYDDLQRTQLELTPEIKAKAAELTKGRTSDADKVRALYDYVAEGLHYISLSFGIGRYQPHAAGDVLGNEYGDCKDKHTLLAALLRAAGIEAWPAIIHSARKLDPDLPSPAQFDHVITVLPQGGSYLWLDTTPEVAPFGMLSANIRDKQALVIPVAKPAMLLTTPANPPFPTALAFTVEGKLAADGTLTAHIDRSSRGDAELFYRYLFRRVAQAEWKKLAQELSNMAGFGGDVSNVQVTPPEDTRAAFDISYDYLRKDYSDWEHHRITPPVPPFGIESQRNDPPKEPFLLGAPGEIIWRARIEVPEGFTPKLPEPVWAIHDFAEYRATYTMEKRVLVAERRLTIKSQEVPPALWDKYLKLRKAVMDDENRWIELELRDQPKTAVAATGSEAQRLFREADAAFRNRDLTKADDYIHRVQKLDPNYPRLHAALGTLANAHNQPELGLEEFRKELEKHPNDPFTNKMLARTLSFLKRQSEAITAWQKVISLDPNDRDAPLALGGLLVLAKRYDEATAILEKAALATPDSAPLRVMLGGAYLRTNQRDKAMATLRRAVELDPSALTLNNAAWTLAEVNVEIEQSRQWAEKAVAMLENEAAKINLAKLEFADLRRMASLAAYWDTLGWVYFRQGDLPSAEKYLHAAWALAQDATIADHLAEVYEKQGKPEAAEHMYELALAASGGDKESIREHYKLLTGRTAPPARLSPIRHASKLPYASPEEELSMIRSIKIAGVPAPGSAEFYVLLAPGGKVEDVKFISGADALRGAVKQIASEKIEAEFPDAASPARLVRRGMLMGGQFVLYPAGAVRSVQ